MPHRCGHDGRKQGHWWGCSQRRHCGVGTALVGQGQEPGVAASKARYSAQLPKELCWKVSVPGKCQPVPLPGAGAMAAVRTAGANTTQCTLQTTPPAALSCLQHGGENSSPGAKDQTFGKERHLSGLVVFPCVSYQVGRKTQLSKSPTAGPSYMGFLQLKPGVPRQHRRYRWGGQEDPVPPTRHLMGDVPHGHAHTPPRAQPRFCHSSGIPLAEP